MSVLPKIDYLKKNRHIIRYFSFFCLHKMKIIFYSTQFFNCMTFSRFTVFHLTVSLWKSEQQVNSCPKCIIFLLLFTEDLTLHSGVSFPHWFHKFPFGISTVIWKFQTLWKHWQTNALWTTIGDLENVLLDRVVCLSFSKKISLFILKAAIYHKTLYNKTIQTCICMLIWSGLINYDRKTYWLPGYRVQYNCKLLAQI